MFVFLFIFLFNFKNKFLLSIFFKKSLFIKINKKKNLFFKRKNKVSILISKRLSLTLRKKRNKKKKFKKINFGKFFFKKFFFKTLLNNRKFLKLFFYLPNKVRQNNISRLVSINQKNFFSKNCTYNYSFMNILLRSGLFLSLKDVLYSIQSCMVFINGLCCTNPHMTLLIGDCVQLKISYTFYKYFKLFKKLLKKKITLYKFNNWKFFKQKRLKKKLFLRFKKRKNPKYMYMFLLFKLSTPKFLEVDYFTLSIFILKKNHVFLNTNYYFNKLFSFKLFSLYNYKKLN